MTADEDLKARPLAEQAVRALAEQAAEIAAERTANHMAEKVVESFFLHIGIDVHDKDAMRELRENLAFLSRMNRGAQEVKKAAIKTCVGALTTGLLALLWLGFKDRFFN